LNSANIDLDTKDQQDKIDLSTRTGLVIGGNIYFALSQNFGLKFEPSFIQKGAKIGLQGGVGNELIEIKQTLKPIFDSYRHFLGFYPS